MLCKKCGYLLSPNDSYCINCGEPVENVKEENISNNDELEVLTLNDKDIDINENNKNVEDINLTVSDINVGSDINTKFENTIEEESMYDLAKPLNEPKEEELVEENNDINLEENNADKIESLDLNEKIEVKNSNKNNNGFLFGLLIGLIIMIVAVTVTYIFTRKLVEKPNLNSSNNKVNAIKDEYKINYLGNIVKIPSEYLYEVKNNELLLASENNDWTSETGLIVGDFDKLKNNFAQIKTNITTLGFTAGNIEVKKINNRENIVVEIMSQAGIKLLCIYTKLDNNSLFYTVLSSKDNTYNYNALEEFLTILDKSKKTDKVVTLNPSLNNVYMSSFILMP